MDIVDPKFRSSGVSFVAVETTSFDFLCANPAAIISVLPLALVAARNGISGASERIRILTDTEGSNPSLSATQSEPQRNLAALLQESLKIAAIP